MSLLVATPCYGMQATEPFMASRDLLHKELLAAGLKHDFLTIGNESLITRARNVIAASFLTETDFESLLFIDADIEFTPDMVAKLWNLCHEGADVAAGCYRFKNPASQHAAWVGGKLRPITDFDKPFKVDYAGTGFMMIRRPTFQRLKKLHPDWEYDEGFPLDERKAEPMKCWAFFQDPITTWHDGRRFQLSEDFFFCNEVRKAPMTVWMHPEVIPGHWGMFRY